MIHPYRNRQINRLSLQISCLLLVISLYAFSTLDQLPAVWNRSPSFQIMNQSTGITDGSDQEALRAAFQTWADAPGSTISFREVTSNADIEVSFLTDWPAEFTQEALASTLTIRQQGQISKAEIFFNEGITTWQTSESQSQQNTSDIQGVGTHEIGHAIGLGHSFYQDAVMYYTGGTVALRSLSPDDIRGVSTLYGGLRQGLLCDTCNNDSECADSICISFGNRNACGQSCDGGCPENSGCFMLNGGGSTCAPLIETCDDEAVAVSEEGEYCFGATHCIGESFCIDLEDGQGPRCTSQGDSPYGTPCATSLECASVLCLPLSANYSECSQECIPDRLNCPNGDECIPVDPDEFGISGVCIPAGRIQEDQICDDQALRCAPSFECINDGANRRCVSTCEPYRDDQCSSGKRCTPRLATWRCEAPRSDPVGTPCSDNDCGGGRYCFAPAGRCVDICDPNVANSCGEGLCFALSGVGICSPDKGQVGDPCSDSIDCAYFACAPTSLGQVCTAPCNEGDCPQNWSCLPTTEGSYCYPDEEIPQEEGIEPSSNPSPVPMQNEAPMIMAVGETSIQSEGCQASQGDPFEALLPLFLLVSLVMAIRKGRGAPLDTHQKTTPMSSSSLLRARSRKRMIRYFSILGLLLMIMIFGYQKLNATTLRPMSMSQVIWQSDLIVRGFVRQQSVTKGAQNWAFTLSKVDTIECFHGHCPDQILVSQVGGTLGTLTYQLEGAPLLSSGQEVILSLRKKSNSQQYVLTSLSKGAILIDRTTQPPTIKSLSHTTLPPKTTHQVLMSRPAQTLESYIKRLQRLLRAVHIIKDSNQ